MKKLKYLKGAVIGTLILASTNVMAEKIRSGYVEDHYREVVYLEPYYVEVCGEETKSAGSIVDGAIWGAIFGTILGDALDIDRGTGAVVGGVLGAKHEENKGTVTTTAIVCKTETRKQSRTVSEYSHSTITFVISGYTYEVDFTKRL